MNEAYFRGLKILNKDRTLDQEGVFSDPLPVVDQLHDEATGMVYLVDYKKRRYQSAKDGYAYSLWIPFGD